MPSTLKVICFAFILALSSASYAQSNFVKFFKLDEVKLLDSPFKNAQEVDKKYIIEMDVDRLLAPYMKDAGIDWTAENYGNWENTGLDGHIGGHYLSALSMMYASTGDSEIKSRLDYMIEQLKLAQDKNANGYIGGVPNGQKIWEEIRAGNIKAGSFSLNDRWVPLYNIHKIYAGLKDAYLIAGIADAKPMLIALSDWFYDLTEEFSEARFQEILISEHGGLNEVFADLAEISGDPKYLTLAKKMSHNLVLDPLTNRQDKLTGMHANTQIPKVIGFQRIAQLSDEAKWNNSATYFWENVTYQRSVSIGGNSVREHFHPKDDFSPMLSSDQGPETCNTYNMMRLSEKLFESSPDRKYIDYYERALYNHILSSQHPTKGGFVYFTPMRPQHYRVYSQPHDNFWCCVGSGLENHAKYGQVIYAHKEDELFVNLFIASELSWEEKGIKLTQKTDFPFSESTTIQFDHKGKKGFKLKIRYPDWVKGGAMEVKVNGKLYPINMSKDGYILIDRKWKLKDQVSVTLPMSTKVEYLADGSPWASFVHGPIVLAAETGKEDLKGIFADDSRMGHVASGKMIPIFQTAILKQTEENILPAKSNDNFNFYLAENQFHNQNQSVSLVPFFNIHESRYQVYWPVLKADEVDDFRKQWSGKDELMLKLESITIDQVAPGEQQPESEHNFKAVSSQSGQENGLFWRSTTTAFQYELKNPSLEAKTLRISYLPIKNGNPFKILINGEVLAEEHFDSEESKKIVDREYNISLFQSEKIEVKFLSVNGRDTEKIHYVRLLKSDQ